MITKILKIKNVGKYLNCAPISNSVWNGEFKKNNLIYGENGSGKTTFTLILKSLGGDNDLLKKIKSFNTTQNQEIDILYRDTTGTTNFKFNNNSWTNHLSNIEIFDIHFINTNVYTGFEIQGQHRKNLLEIVLGQQGVQLKTDIQTIKERLKNGNKVLKETELKIDLVTEKLFTIQNFCNLPIDNQIDYKIQEKTKEIELAKSYQEIQAKNSLKKLSNIQLEYDLVQLQTILSKTVITISQEYLALVNKHMEHLGNQSENWLKQGSDYIKQDCCPFCLRPFDTEMEIIKAYSQYFNKEYNLLIAEIETVGKYFSTLNIVLKLSELDKLITQNKTLFEFWSKHIEFQQQISEINFSNTDFANLLNNLNSEIEQKSLNPTKEVPVDDVKIFFSKLDDLNSIVETVNIQIETINALIDTLKRKQNPNIATLQTELKKLNIIKKKENQDVVTLCNDFTRYKQAITTLNSQKEQKTTQLDNYSRTVFSTYTQKINSYLRVFAPYLKIRDFDSEYKGTGTEPYAKFALEINGNKISIDENSNSPVFKYALSEGDKSSLAFAFFLAKLEVEGSLQDKIIIFDDPVSSFDQNRKSATINQLYSLGENCKQLFILTHNILFAGAYWKDCNKSPTATCQIGFLNSSSQIAYFDIDNETISGLIKDSMELKKFLQNGVLHDTERRIVVRCIRPLLESYYQLKFYEHFTGTDWLGDFIEQIRNSTNGHRLNRLTSHLADIIDINNYSKKYHHRFNPNADSELVTDNELRNFVQRTIELIELT